MDNIDTPMENTSNSNNELIITRKSAEYLNETESWTKFLAIVGFIFVGLIVIMALFASTIFSSLPLGPNNNFSGGMVFLFSGLYFLMAILYFFPTWYLYKFSKSLKTAIRQKDHQELELALSNHKSFFKFMGIFTIVVLAFYGLALLISLIGLF